MTPLQSGQNVALTTNVVTLEMATQAPPGFELDPSAFSLTEAGKVEDDRGFTFYGQPEAPDGSIRLQAAAGTFSLDLGRVPASITRIAICLTIDKGNSRGQTFSGVGSVKLNLRDGANTLSFSPATEGMSETALILGEVYRRNDQWKFRALGQGFNGGLAPLATHFGVDVTDDPDSGPGQQANPPPVPQPTHGSPAPAPRPAPTIKLSKITLQKSEPVDLSKQSGKFGKITVNLNWEQTPAGLAGLFKGGVDLDLGCMIEHLDGSNGVVQALGNSFGNYHADSLCQLRGDDRTGANREGEFIDINGDQWNQFKRVLIFAFIYKGVPNWSKAGAKVTIRMPGQPDLEAVIDSPNNRDGMCAIATLENHSGSIRATKQVRYFPGHREMDQAFGFDFRWQAGTK
jgi:tellurite resistance protein TerA